MQRPHALPSGTRDRPEAQDAGYPHSAAQCICEGAVLPHFPKQREASLLAVAEARRASTLMSVTFALYSKHGGAAFLVLLCAQILSSRAWRCNHIGVLRRRLCGALRAAAGTSLCRASFGRRQRCWRGVQSRGLRVVQGLEEALLGRRSLHLHVEVHAREGAGPAQASAQGPVLLEKAGVKLPQR